MKKNKQRERENSNVKSTCFSYRYANDEWILLWPATTTWPATTAQCKYTICIWPCARYQSQYAVVVGYVVVAGHKREADLNGQMYKCHDAL